MAKRKPKHPLTYEVKHKRKRLNKNQRIRVYEKYHYMCNECGPNLKSDNAKKVLDHIIPLSQLGSNDFDNFQLLCGECDRKKGSKVRPYAVKKRINDLLEKEEERKRGVKEEVI